MSKRFTDTEKWKKPFIRSLQAPYKLLWLYILDECDHAGIWQVDFDVAKIKTGEKRLNKQEALKCLNAKIIPFEKGEKWFIPDFIYFQYGELNPSNRAHQSVLQILKKNNLLINNKPLTSPLQGAKDKDMDMDMDMDKEGGLGEKIDEAGQKLEKFIKPTSADIIAYLLEEGVTTPSMEADKFIDFYTSKDWMVGKNKMKDWKAAVRNWFRNIYQTKKTENGTGKIDPNTFEADLAAVCAR